jgi:hypothetical protein
MVTTGSVMTVTGSRMQSPVMLEIAVGENSPGFTPSSGSSVLPAPFRTPKKNSGPFSVTHISRPQLPGSGATFSILRAFLLKWEIRSQLAGIFSRRCPK